MRTRVKFNSSVFDCVIDEYVKLYKQHRELQKRKNVLRDKIIKVMKTHSMNVYETKKHALRFSEGSTRRFIGGFKAFKKAFGENVALRWFKESDRNQITIVK